MNTLPLHASRRNSIESRSRWSHTETPLAVVENRKLTLAPTDHYFYKAQLAYITYLHQFPVEKLTVWKSNQVNLRRKVTHSWKKNHSFNLTEQKVGKSPSWYTMKQSLILVILFTFGMSLGHLAAKFM